MIIIDGIKYRRVNDLTGRIFGYLTVMKFHHIDKKWKGSWWECLCRCDNIKIARSKTLLSGMLTSCGCKIKNKLKQGESGFNSLFRAYQKGAERRKLEFSLTKEYFRELVTSNCFYCEAEPSQESFNGSEKHGSKGGNEHSRFVYNGIDRLSNKRGYIEKNCVTCCKRCNLAKHSMLLHEFIEWICRCYKNLLSKGMGFEEFIEKENIELA